MNSGERLHISKQAFNRLKACILIEDGGFSMKNACQRVGIARQKFSERKWLSIYRKDPFDVVREDKRGGTPTKLTTPVKAEFKKVARQLSKKRRCTAGAVMLEVAEKRNLDSQVDDPMPALRSVQRFLADEMEGDFVKTRPKMMVRTPWHARWRLHFANTELKHISSDPLRGRKIIHSDEKKFCLWDVRGPGTYIFPDEYGEWPDANVASNMTDSEYLEWRQQRKLEACPSSKERGLYPVFVWGALGFNYKSKLFIFKEKQRLTGSLYKTILRTCLLPSARRWAKRVRQGRKSSGRQPKFLFIHDNDPKHTARQVRAWIKRMKVVTVTSPRLNENGTQDKFHHTHGPYANQLCWDSFPPYSPDANSVIEKAWRRLQLRVLERAGEIGSRADMTRVILEEWKRLEFEPSNDGWIGINAWCDKYKSILEDIKISNGWDSRFMK